MRRGMVACQVAIAALFLSRLLLHPEIVRWIPAASFWSLADHAQAIAQTAPPAQPPLPSAAAPVRDVTEDGVQKERELALLLQKKQKELDGRESSLRAEMQRMNDLKKEIVDKLDRLKALETHLEARLDEEKAAEQKRIKELAKVYEATPPQKAAAMLEKLAVRTAAGITINMKRERAGLIWGHLSPQKAVEITNEIARTARPAADGNAQR